MNKKISLTIFLWIALFLYIALAGVIHIRALHPTLFIPTRFAYYNYLVEALLNGRFNVVGMMGNHDLSLFHGKWYLYWGPGPIIFILPFYIVWGVHASDIVYTLAAGIANILLMYLVIEECIRYYKLNISSSRKLLIVACFAFTSPHLTLTTLAGIWHTNQIIATFYLLLSYLFFFKYLQNKHKTKWIIFSTIFFNLAWFSRYILFFNILIYLYPILIYRKNFSVIKKIILIVIFITVFFFGLFGTYNYFRFGSVKETGHGYQRANLQEFNTIEDKAEATRYVTLQKQGKVFSWKYIPHNVIHYFFNNATLSIEKPYVNISAQGNSIFSMYPFFILIVYIFRRKVFLNHNRAHLIFIFTTIVIINLVLLLGYVTSGWQQFGSRYFLDVVPQLLLLITLIIEDVPYSLQYTFISYGLIINILGIFRYIRLF